MTSKIKRVDTGLYRIPLEAVLSDSTHGTMTHFELIAVRIYNEDGAEGMGYTFTVGANGSAIREQIVRDLTPMLVGQASSMNQVAVFAGLLFWSWVWGIWGMLLAVPMMMVIKVICDHFEPLQPVGHLLGE